MTPEQTNTATTCLQDLRVIDLSRILAGPFASQCLGDLGATVIKVEHPNGGDETRRWGPPFWADTDFSAYFLCANRNKRFVAIDLTTTEGQQLLGRLIEWADVLLDNFKVGTLAAWGFSRNAIVNLNPRLIHCAITGYGQTGPDSQRPGYDLLVQAQSGMMSITGSAAGPPTKVGVAVADVTAGLYATTAILAALEQRHRTGTGQFIDISLLEAQLAGLANQAQNYLSAGLAPTRRGNEHPSIVPYESFPTADEHIVIAAATHRQFTGLCAVLGHPHWAEDSRFSSNAKRVEHRQQLIPLLTTALMQDTSVKWLQCLAKAAVPAAPINSLEQAFSMAQVQERGVVERVMVAGHPQPMALVRSPMRFADTQGSCRLPPAKLGEHTDEVLETILQLGSKQRATLRQKGVIGP